MHHARPAAAATTVAAALVAPLLAAASPAQAAGITYISFEDVASSCGFASVAPLRGRYAAAKFTGPAADDGGAVLDSCASFGVTPRTGSRFLAFNPALSDSMTNGGTPVGPEKITFPVRQKRVTVWVSQGFGGNPATFKMAARRGSSLIRSTTSTTTTNAWVELTISNRRGIDSVTVSAPVEPDGAWVLDDLTAVS